MNTSNNQRKVHSRGTETGDRKPGGYTERGIPKLGLCCCLGQLSASEDGAPAPIPTCTFRSGSIKASRPERWHDEKNFILPGGGISIPSGLAGC